MSTSASAFDLDAYFARIGYSGARAATVETLHALAWHHATSIPFENLDVLLGRPIVLTPEALMAKLVYGKRGGYCFEQNNLLRLALTALGFRLTPLGARVRWQIPREVVPARTHLFLRVHFPEGDWMADVGLGAASLTAPLRFDFGPEQSTPHEPRRLLNEGGRFFHQMKLGDDWSDVHEFTLDEMHPVDWEVANWWTSASPTSYFRNNLALGRALRDGTRKAIRSDGFAHRRGGEVLARQPISSAAELHALLTEHFDLHFPTETRFGPPGAPWAQARR
ncbi:MAG: arylamine N-acetyltransferase [Opitutus sp.]|nr:arylamine N-acetyltransferase [Opitutus sp.]